MSGQGSIIEWLAFTIPVVGALIAWILAQINAARREAITAVEQQNRYRHDNTNRIVALIGEMDEKCVAHVQEVETRLTRRIDRLENNKSSLHDGKER